MEKKSILAGLLLLVAGLQTAWAQKVLLYKTNSQAVEFQVSELDSIVFVEAGGATPDENEWVDLGLPSGTLWATCNIGASSPEEYGDYFAWGETKPKDSYNWSTYFDTEDGGDTFKKYNLNGGLSEILPEDDAAAVNWGGRWRMPSLDQIKELINSSYTMTEWVMVNGVWGRKVTSKVNGNSIFLPAAGYQDGTSRHSRGSYGHYWSSSLNQDQSSYAYFLYFNSSNISLYDYNRSFGWSVRAVCVGSGETKLVTGITLSSSSLSLEVGKTQTLTATVLPSDATNKRVTWTSSNASVATISTSGQVTAKAVGTCTITATAKDGSGVKAECQVTVKQTGINGHAFVEIGGLKWATMNVGATTVAGSYATCYGDYYAWGETQPRYASITRTASNAATFTWKNGYSDGYSSKNYPSYTGTTLDARHDAARANWGSTWRTPTKAEYEALAVACSGSSANNQKPVELINAITEGGIYWLSSAQTIESAYTGVAGLLFVSKADISKRVFFPASGSVYDTSLSSGGTNGYYWSSSLYTSSTYYAYYLLFYSSSVNPSSLSYRCSGRTVRPVSD